MVRWAKIYVGEGVLYQFTPAWYYSFFCGVVRYLSGRRHGCRFLRVARVARLLAPRRLLMIHGERDSYIVPEVAKQLYQCASDPKEFWLVPGAKHNASIHVAGERYRGKLLEFFLGE